MFEKRAVASSRLRSDMAAAIEEIVKVAISKCDDYLKKYSELLDLDARFMGLDFRGMMMQDL